MKLDKLLKKREQLEAEIAKAEALEKRKNAILAMPEFEKIASLPDAVLRTAFAEIAAQN